jgi:hypothetical protein
MRTIPDAKMHHPLANPLAEPYIAEEDRGEDQDKGAGDPRCMRKNVP